MLHRIPEFESKFLKSQLFILLLLPFFPEQIVEVIQNDMRRVDALPVISLPQKFANPLFGDALDPIFILRELFQFIVRNQPFEQIGDPAASGRSIGNPQACLQHTDLRAVNAFAEIGIPIRIFFSAAFAQGLQAPVGILVFVFPFNDVFVKKEPALQQTLNKRQRKLFAVPAPFLFSPSRRSQRSAEVYGRHTKRSRNIL